MRRVARPDCISAGAVVILVSLSGGTVSAQPDRPSVSAARIDARIAPVIDGDLGDGAWRQATATEALRQRRPNPGANASERTVVRVMYDENNLYFGVYAYDSEPDRITVRAMAHDGPIETGDKIAIYLDPGLTRRDAYFFQVGASGGRTDSLILNNAEELENWDPIWSASARIVADGWTAEIAIPFQSLSYDQNQPDWGFDFTRHIRRKNEAIQWATVNPALGFTDVSQAGTITGIADVSQGLGLDVQLYGVAHAKRDWHIPGEDTGISFTAGGNAFYRITPALTGTLTYNPDFSDAPLDARQVNTTRFSLFTPETRDFFLQDAAAFEFGGRSFSRDRDANNGRPFFSRNIGLVEGRQVSIVGGGKLSGRYGGFGIGALGAVTAGNPIAPGQFLSALRITRSVLDESRIGMIVTHGDPTGLTGNTVAGADFQFRDSAFFGGGILQSDFFYERSFSSAEGQDHTFGVAVSSPNEPWGWDANFKQIGADFEPALGFVNRPGVRLYDGNLRHVSRYADWYLRELRLQGFANVVTDLHGNLETRVARATATAISASDDTFVLSAGNNFEYVGEEFDVAGVAVPPGRYKWTNLRAQVRTSASRIVSLDLQVFCCSFYNGDSIEGDFGIVFHPNQYYELSGNLAFDFIDLPAGSVDIFVLTLDGMVNFTPNMTLALQGQYDNVSKAFGFLSRYRWEFAPGDELFVAFGQAAILDNRFMAQRSLFSVRVGRTFRF